MTTRLSTIGDLIFPVQTWNPLSNTQDGTFPYIDLSSVDNEAKVIRSTQEIRFKEAPSRARQLVKRGDILVSTVRPNLNGVAKLDDKYDGATASTGFCVLRPNPQVVCSSYLFQWVKSPTFVSDMTKKATGQSYPAVSDRIIAESAIPLPSLDEQRRIGSILDQADDLRRKRREAIDSIRSAAHSIFRLLILSEPNIHSIPFKDAVSFQEGPGVRNWQFRDRGTKLINVKNIVGGELDTSNTSRYLDPNEVAAKYSHFLLSSGDLVMASSGVTWGKIAEVRDVDLPLCLNTSMIRITPANARYEKAYIRAFIEFGSFRSQIMRLITGSAQPNFGPSHLRKVLIPAVSSQGQRQFAKQTSALNELLSRNGEHLAKLDALFASLQHRAFRGEL